LPLRAPGRILLSADLKDARAMDTGGERYRKPLHQQERSTFEVMIDSRKPLLAIVNGPATAGGFELALSCDMRVVADTAWFSLPEARRGMGAHFASVVLPQMVPMGIAME
jgi:enoyl-CoA hydratase/carnithine racemase